MTLSTEQLEELEADLFAFLSRKYVQRADARQKAMGLVYTEAETHDLAKELARFPTLIAAAANRSTAGFGAEGVPVVTGQPFERYPALASWIADLAHSPMAMSLSEWGEFLEAVNDALTTAELAAAPKAPTTPDLAVKELVDDEPRISGPRSTDTEMTDFLSGVVGVVDANSFEKHLLWDENRRAEKPKSWSSSNIGLMHVVGQTAGMPVCVSLFTSDVDGHRLLFIDATSQVVDHRMIDEWLKNTLPKSAFRDDGYPNRTDAMNFHNVFRTRALAALGGENQAEGVG